MSDRKIASRIALRVAKFWNAKYLSEYKDERLTEEEESILSKYLDWAAEKDIEATNRQDALEMYVWEAGYEEGYRGSQTLLNKRELFPVVRKIGLDLEPHYADGLEAGKQLS